VRPQLHARLGEILYVSIASSSDEAAILKNLSESMRRFCRSIELCNDYLRGYYGLKLTTKRLLEVLQKSSKSVTSSSENELPPPTVATVQRLHELATSKLAEAIRRNTAGEKGWDGYDEAEIIAARALLDRDTKDIER